MERMENMESFALSERRLSREELVTGIGGSILVHVLVVAMALISPWLMPGKLSQTPYFSVNLVSLQDLGPGFSGPVKGPGEKSAAQTKAQEASKSPTPARTVSSPVVPIKRLHMDEPSTKTEPDLKKMQSHEAPKVTESTQSTASVEKSLDKLIHKPKPESKPAPITQSSREESVRQASGQEKGDQGSSSADQRPNRTTSAGRDGNQRATGQGGGGGSEGSPAGSVDGSGRVASALLGMYGSRVKEAINRQWAVPDVVKPQGLETKLIVIVSKDGRILDLRIEKASGNSLFDESAIRAVRKASPLPALPEVITFSQVEIAIRFRPEGLS